MRLLDVKDHLIVGWPGFEVRNPFESDTFGGSGTAAAPAQAPSAVGE